MPKTVVSAFIDTACKPASAMLIDRVHKKHSPIMALKLD
ncbi:MAG: hypothetical protein OFPII_36240 [Osedax symbiont Rs1]|nr:MAG: hypothetical protein OFPII_36240 [Osedax symbiont Rs1]